MFEKYFDGVIEQVYERVTKAEKNIVMACYSNSFSVGGLESIKRYSESEDNVFFTWKEYEQGSLVGAYDPFLDVICEIFRKEIKGDFNEFLTNCQVYELHREILNSYYQSGNCRRIEAVLWDEVEYEQHRMAKTICLMMKAVAEYKPIVMVINRFQVVGKSSINLVNLLIEEDIPNLGVVLGVNEAHIRKDSRQACWKKLTENLGDLGQIYHIGSSGEVYTKNYTPVSNSYIDYAKIYVQLNNIIELLDFEQANEYFLNIERRIKFEEVKMEDSVKLSLYFMHVKVKILMGDMSKALDIIEDISKLHVPERENYINYQCSMDLATCYMYQGKLDVAYTHAKEAKEFAAIIGKDEFIFQAELLMLRSQMSGWHNIFFCVTDVRVESSLVEKLLHYNYRNHLAHIYIYAYDNKPEMVMKAYRSESALVHFSKGIKLAKELGNEHLVCNAYQKNAMIASTNGMNEIALLYSVRSYQFVQDKNSLVTGRMLSAIGYNLSALGHMEESTEFYQRAIALFYKLQLPEDIAEVCYNQALTKFTEGKYKEAEKCLSIALKIIDKLHLNSLRVCNVAKLYAIQSLLSTLQGRRFDAERYLLSCAQFMNYLIVKQDEEIVHDFARSDDDICLYQFAKALHELSLGNESEALEVLEKTEEYFQGAEGNLFYIHVLYRQCRMHLYEKTDHRELFENERTSLLQYQELMTQVSAHLSVELLDEVRDASTEFVEVSRAQIEELVRREALVKENKQNKRQLEFISTWQNLLDKRDVRVLEMVRNSIRLFLNHFNNDCAMYVRYEGEMPRVLYNDTNISFTEGMLREIETRLEEYPLGIAVSKITHTFFEHQDLISLFDLDEVCSFVAVPFFKDGKLESFFITYIKMKDNWHDSVNRYLLNEDDLRIYQLLIRELGHAIVRQESYEKIYRMNKQLQEAATTDVLTGITNRMGMYARAEELLEKRKKISGLGVMFIDLDNFKPYNDTYGHEIGDIVLQGMAKIFDAAVGSLGFVSRYGGDEFIIVTYINEKDQIETIAKDIYARIQKADGFVEKIEKTLGMSVEIQSHHKIGCSIGIAISDAFKEVNQLDELIKCADDSLYNVKATGKGTYIFA